MVADFGALVATFAVRLFVLAALDFCGSGAASLYFRKSGSRP